MTHLLALLDGGEKFATISLTFLVVGVLTLPDASRLKRRVAKMSNDVLLVCKELPPVFFTVHVFVHVRGVLTNLLCVGDPLIECD